MNQSTYNDICEYLKQVTYATQWEGHIFTVGGCCRDSLMNLDIHDIDLAVTLPDGGVEFAIWLRQKGLLAEPPVLFKKYSTSRLRLKDFPEHEIEVVQTRKEKYTDRTSRNPEIAFGSLEEDCFRRDLTINSLYKDISTGQILDLTGKGISDIENHRIRTPLDPDTIFDDDPVRILRTIRFANRYGWDIPSEIFESMKRNYKRLTIIRPPRLASEFEKMILGPRVDKSLSMLRTVGALQFIIPDIFRTYRFKISDNDGEAQTLWHVILENFNQAPPSLPERYAVIIKGLALLPERDKKKNDAENDKVSKQSWPVDRVLRRLGYRTPFIKSVKRTINGNAPATDTNTAEGKKKDSGQKKRRRYFHRRRRNSSSPKKTTGNDR